MRRQSWTKQVGYLFTYTSLTVFHFSRGRCPDLMRWHFEIYFCQHKTFSSLSPSQRCVRRLTAHSPGSGRGFERKFSPASSFLPMLHLRQARWPGVQRRRSGWREGTRRCRAVEMAVSIKYHFQFPCFMIPRLLSTNNPPVGRPSYLVSRKIDYTCRLL